MPHYRCEHQGEEFSREVVLRPWHQFVRDGGRYLLNIEEMTSHRITVEFGESLERLGEDPDISIPSGLLLILGEFGLIGLPGPPSRGADSGPAISDAIMKELRKLPVARISLNVSQACNLNCTYCQGDAGTYARPGLMTEETAFRTVDWFLAQANEGVLLNMAFFGGEPLLNFPLIRKIVAYTDQRAEDQGKRIAYQLTTNGLLLDQSIFDFCKGHGIIPWISFDGPAAIHDANRPTRDGKGSHEALTRKIEPLLAQIPETLGRATVRNETSYEEVVVGLKAAGFSRYLCGVTGPAPFGDFSFRGEDVTPFSNRVPFLRRCAEDMVGSVKDRTFPPQTSTELDEFLRALVFRTRKFFACKAGWGCLAVDRDGGLFPCSSLVGISELRQGHVESGGFEREAYLGRTVRSLTPCAGCWARYFCGGGCMFLNRGTSGDVDTPFEPFCTVTRVGVEMAIAAFHELDDSDLRYLRELPSAGADTELSREECPG